MLIVADSVWRHWKSWELPLRMGVISSLFLQIVLTIYGNRRKYWPKSWVSILLWIAYLSANWLVSTTLGMLVRKDPKHKSLETNYAMTALWAPILLVHLGGPDTITGYSLEDNELWVRSFIVLAVRFLMACYVIWISWNTSPLNFIAFPVFVAALVKCGERTWALRSANGQIFRNSVLRDPNYAKFIDEYCSKEREGYRVSVARAGSEASAVSLPWPLPLQLHPKIIHGIEDAQVVCDAHYVFKVFKPLFADLLLSFQDLENSLNYFTKKLWDQVCEVPGLQDDNSRKLYEARTAFRIIEVELGFMYDLLHTKTYMFYTYWHVGASFRIVSILSIVSAFIAFSIIDKGKYFGIEVLITYVLLAVAIALELYAVIALLSSDWAILWICKLKMMGLPIYKIISVLRCCHIVPANERWSNSMSQLSLISICLKEKPAWWPNCLKKKAHNIELFVKFLYEYQADVDERLKLLIYNCLKEEVTSDSGREKAWTHRGDQAPEVKDILQNVAFDQSILLWHIATTLCYCNPDSDPSNEYILESEQHQMSMKLSNYMMYLLITCPFMLPNGIGLIRYRDTRAEAFDFLEERKTSTKESTETRVKAACGKLLAVNTDIVPAKVKGDQSKSVLFDACRLAKSLCNVEPKTRQWDIISRAWVEMLAYAASRCTWNNHARKLAEGGELLSHVWLLMAHLGITDHFQTSEDYATAKLEAT